MHKGASCESIKRTTVMSFSSKSNVMMETVKPDRPGPSKDKFKKQWQTKRQYNMPYMSDSLIVPRVKQVNYVKKYRFHRHSKSLGCVQNEVN
jgi:hypothetical protein